MCAHTLTQCLPATAPSTQLVLPWIRAANEPQPQQGKCLQSSHPVAGWLILERTRLAGYVMHPFSRYCEWELDGYSEMGSWIWASAPAALLFWPKAIRAFPCQKEGFQCTAMSWMAPSELHVWARQQPIQHLQHCLRDCSRHQWLRISAWQKQRRGNPFLSKEKEVRHARAEIQLGRCKQDQNTPSAAPCQFSPRPDSMLQKASWAFAGLHFLPPLPPNVWLLSEGFVFPWEITQLNICSWKENHRRQTATTY